MGEPQPNPDDLLEHFREETKASKRGKLKVFFGYAAGVGKTYSMLEAARAQASAGAAVVLGYVEPHARPETEALTSTGESSSRSSTWTRRWRANPP